MNEKEWRREDRGMGKEGWKNGGRKWRGWKRRGGGMLGEE